MSSGQRTPMQKWFNMFWYWRMVMVDASAYGEGRENELRRQPITEGFITQIDKEDFAELQDIIIAYPNCDLYVSRACQCQPLINFFFDIAVQWHVPLSLIAFHVWGQTHYDAWMMEMYEAAHARIGARRAAKRERRRARLAREARGE